MVYDYLSPIHVNVACRFFVIDCVSSYFAAASFEFMTLPPSQP